MPKAPPMSSRMRSGHGSRPCSTACCGGCCCIFGWWCRHAAVSLAPMYVSRRLLPCAAAAAQRCYGTGVGYWLAHVMCLLQTLQLLAILLPVAGARDVVWGGALLWLLLSWPLTAAPLVRDVLHTRLQKPIHENYLLNIAVRSRSILLCSCGECVSGGGDRRVIARSPSLWQPRRAAASEQNTQQESFA